MTDLTLSRAGATLSYDVEGDGPTVLQAHGLTSSRDADLALLDLRPLAAHGHRLVRYDAAGHGRSAGPDDPERYRWTALADDLRTWWSYRENVGEDPALAIAFLDMFIGSEPNWVMPDSAASRSAMKRAQAAKILP